jgi:hypothetical protein
MRDGLTGRSLGGVEVGIGPEFQGKVACNPIERATTKFVLFGTGRQLRIMGF